MPTKFSEYASDLIFNFLLLASIKDSENKGQTTEFVNTIELLVDFFNRETDYAVTEETILAEYQKRI